MERVAACARVAIVHNTEFARPPFSRQMVGEGTEIGNKMEKEGCSARLRVRYSEQKKNGMRNLFCGEN